MPEHGSSPNLDILREVTGRGWQNLADAAKRSEERFDEIEKALQSSPSPIPVDCSMILYGSLARRECTEGSDCDWTLLVDGMAKGEHHANVVDVRQRLTTCSLSKPGPTGVFGTLVFSHDLVHQIGGQEDTNQITTRRVLMLLESAAVNVANSKEVRDRVTRQVIQRYLESGPSLVSIEHDPRCPRFLLNDVVRYWRTMAVDYARKTRDFRADGWALRNIKLRLSRKLMFSSGLLSCFDCLILPDLNQEQKDDLREPSRRADFIQEYLLKRVNSTPIEILAKAIKDYAIDDIVKSQLATQLFDSYDEFIGNLNDPGFRSHLESLPPDDADTDSRFQEARQVGKRFQKGLMDLFFYTNDELAEATRQYGVF